MWLGIFVVCNLVIWKWLIYCLLYKTPDKNMSVCLSVDGVICAMKCSCPDRIHQPLLFFTLI